MSVLVKCSSLLRVRTVACIRTLLVPDTRMIGLVGMLAYAAFCHAMHLVYFVYSIAVILILVGN